jgi:hypothetical protein
LLTEARSEARTEARTGHDPEKEAEKECPGPVVDECDGSFVTREFFPGMRGDDEDVGLVGEEVESSYQHGVVERSHKTSVDFGRIRDP